ncbi:hypothetical protein BC938DRAFT_479165 [Jimgerdemannia flammicorona]|uniref:Uncharacterized protein n=1 Tax=Jimgerdemannia flammicorona TaxID=994334 RepID=A0A433QLG4_9FUNG|nr:hypothetical protein BC938DRAFT_479165 [Jimgerdemannia flammicorona]
MEILRGVCSDPLLLRHDVHVWELAAERAAIRPILRRYQRPTFTTCHSSASTPSQKDWWTSFFPSSLRSQNKHPHHPRHRHGQYSPSSPPISTWGSSTASCAPTRTLPTSAAPSSSPPDAPLRPRYSHLLLPGRQDHRLEHLTHRSMKLTGELMRQVKGAAYVTRDWRHQQFINGEEASSCLRETGNRPSLSLWKATMLFGRNSNMS